MTAKVFIDGEAGTTGLQIRSRLEARGDVQLLHLADSERKDATRRAALLNQADLAILCLPDAAAREAVALIDNPAVKVIDASSAHRVDPAFTYGFPELTAGQAERIAEARLVSNPGCYPTGAAGILRPLVDGGLVPADFPVTVNAISGYSGGGRKLIERHEGVGGTGSYDPYQVYGLDLEHKHVEEMRRHGGLAHRPIFVPSVGHYAQGMIVQVPLQLWALPGAVTPADLHDCLAAHYQGQAFVSVAPRAEGNPSAVLTPEGLNGTNLMRLQVFGNGKRGQAVVAALLDNLGKGASGAAVQNMNLMLDLAPDSGLSERLVA